MIAPIRQQGAALMLSLIIIVAALSFFLLSHLKSRHKLLRYNDETERALQQAKSALIGYAMTNARFGEFPCPDLNNDGVAENSCTTSNNVTIGRLPWKTLNLTNLRDAAGERLWYGLSDNFSNNSNGNINSNTTGQITLDSTIELAAVVLAPGYPYGTQTARPNNAITDYAEDDNADNDAVFVTTAGGNFNDRLRAIETAELFVGSFGCTAQGMGNGNNCGTGGMGNGNGGNNGNNNGNSGNNSGMGNGNNGNGGGM